jgi:hypothetical protein
MISFREEMQKYRLYSIYRFLLPAADIYVHKLPAALLSIAEIFL